MASTVPCAILQGMDFDHKLLFSRKDSAAVLGISVRALDYAIANGLLPIRRVGRRILISATSLRQFTRQDHPQPLSVPTKHQPPSPSQKAASSNSSGLASREIK